jgi:hypothetical protein
MGTCAFRTKRTKRAKHANDDVYNWDNNFDKRQLQINEFSTEYHRGELLALREREKIKRIMKVSIKVNEYKLIEPNEEEFKILLKLVSYQDLKQVQWIFSKTPILLTDICIFNLITRAIDENAYHIAIWLWEQYAIKIVSCASRCSILEKIINLRYTYQPEILQAIKIMAKNASIHFDTLNNYFDSFQYNRTNIKEILSSVLPTCRFSMPVSVNPYYEFAKIVKQIDNLELWIMNKMYNIPAFWNCVYFNININTSTPIIIWFMENGLHQFIYPLLQNGYDIHNNEVHSRLIIKLMEKNFIAKIILTQEIDKLKRQVESKITHKDHWRIIFHYLY